MIKALDGSDSEDGGSEMSPVKPEIDTQQALRERERILNQLKTGFEREIERTFDHYGDSKEGMPTWEQIEERLTPEILDKAIVMEKMGLEPEIVMVSPHVKRQAAIDSIDAHKETCPAKRSSAPNDSSPFTVFARKFKDFLSKLHPAGFPRTICFHDPNNNDLWNGGAEYPKERKWIVKIGTGVENVANYSGVRDANYDRSQVWSNYDRSKDWLKWFQDAGLEITNDLDTLLAQIKQALVNGRRLDTKTATVLNAKNLTAQTGVALSICSAGLCFYSANSGGDYGALRGRAEIMVGEF